MQGNGERFDAKGFLDNIETFSLEGVTRYDGRGVAGSQERIENRVGRKQHFIIAGSVTGSWKTVARLHE